MKLLTILLIMLGCCFPTRSSAAADLDVSNRPNIIWIIPDDMSANFSCYGETAIETPHVDRLAREGVKFTNAYVTAPVCSTCRSALITGMYQTSIGAHHHRSGRGEKKIRLDREIRLVPELFQEAGYHTSICVWPTSTTQRGKTDYNFEWDPSIYDGSDWSQRNEGQPFFAQIHTPGGKARGRDQQGWQRVAQRAERELGSSTPVEAVTLPPYYPDHPDIRRDWAAYLDTVRLTDKMVGEVMARLQREGIRDNTLVLFMTDHGISHARGKQFLYDEGVHVPLVISGPGIEAGTVREDLVEHIDLAALSLAAAGIELPAYMQAKNILSPDYTSRVTVFAARDRCDETVDLIRSVRTQRFKYIRNFLPQRPYLQPCAYKDAKQILISLRAWHSQGKLSPAQELHLSQVRPEEELYDVRNDPFEINNLANNPRYIEVLTALRRRLDTWMVETNDQGRVPESDEMYESDMQIYLSNIKARPNSPDHLQVIEKNISLMKRWAAEGK